MDKDATSMDSDRQPRYVGFWMRVVASIIDSLLVSFLVYPLLYALGALDPITAGKTGGLVGVLINFVLPAVAIVMFWIYRSATPGKMVIGAAIADAKTLGKPSTGQLIGRYFGYYVSTVALMLGFVWIAFDRRKQGWHDKLAGTVVIRARDYQNRALN